MGKPQNQLATSCLLALKLKRIWCLSPLGLHIPVEDVSSFRCWLELMMSSLPNEGLPWLFSLIWAIWKRRNLWLFETKRTPPNQVVLQASLMYLPSRSPEPQTTRAYAPLNPKPLHLPIGTLYRETPSKLTSTHPSEPQEERV